MDYYIDTIYPNSVLFHNIFYIYIPLSYMLVFNTDDMYTTTVMCTMMWSTLNRAILSAYSWTPINTSTLPSTPEVICSQQQ